MPHASKQANTQFESQLSKASLKGTFIHPHNRPCPAQVACLEDFATASSNHGGGRGAPTIALPWQLAVRLMSSVAPFLTRQICDNHILCHWQLCDLDEVWAHLSSAPQPT